LKGFFMIRLSLIITLVIISSVFGATNSSTYRFSAKEMASDRKAGVTIFKGDAKIIKIDETSKKSGDESDHVYADQISVYRDAETNEIIKIEAIGNVNMREGDLLSTCAHAIMYESEDRIEMDGSPAIVDDGKNKIEAPSITFYRKENRLEAKGNVSGYITIEEKEEKAQKD